MSAEEKVFSIDDLRLIILSYAIKHPDEPPLPTFYIKLKQRCKKICKNIKKKWENFILKILMKMLRIQIPFYRI